MAGLLEPSIKFSATDKFSPLFCHRIYEDGYEKRKHNYTAWPFSWVLQVSVF